MRTRLMAVIAVPLVLLLAVAVPEAQRRWDRAGSADEAAATTADAVAVMGAIDAIQQERTVAAASRAGAVDEVAGALRAQRDAADSAVARAVAAVDRLEGSAELATDLEAARSGLQLLEQARDDMDLAQSIVPWTDPLAPVIAPLLDLQESLGVSAGQAGIGDDLRLAGLLGRLKEATAAQAAQMAAAATWGELRGDQAGILTDLRADEAAFRTAYLSASDTATRVERRTELAAGAGTTAARAVDLAITDGAPSGTTDLDAWLSLSDERQDMLRELEASTAQTARAQADALGSDSRQESTVYVLFAGLGLLLALALALLAARSITGPLRRLTEAADHLAEERLPKLVDALRNPGDDDERYLAATMEAIPVDSGDELAHLGRSFNAVQAVAVEVAAQQADLLRKGISDLYVNLARRNQSLIDRQIQLLDRLEGGEQDPEVLEHLFLLDHLATRMRRNAESLLILAGAESGPRRSRPVATVDVVRAAMSEVEEYERVDLGSLADATLHGPAVSDVAHLIAELLENATQFSPPDTMVRVDGIRTGGSYQLVITDHGVGMSEDQLEELNAVLRDPPVTGLALGKALGCLVAARLAARHGITVRLRRGESEGVVAYVVLPRHLLEEEAAEPISQPVIEALRPRPSVPELEPQEPWEAEWEAPVVVETAAPIEPPPAVPHTPFEPAPMAERLRDALPAQQAFDASLQALLDGEAPPARVEPPVTDDQTAPQEAPGPGGLLPRRVPGATASDDVGASASEPRQRRSPDEVRAMLSRYRAGLSAGRSNEGPSQEDEG
ncbi:MAG: nitrate- and nitrite sensing domain-containing protein [Acidimicrobiales bacterium]